MSGIFNECHVKNLGFYSRKRITVFLVAYKLDLHILKDLKGTNTEHHYKK